MTNRIKGQIEPGAELAVKRLYLPGIVLESVCPACGDTTTVDFEYDYVSFPLADTKFSREILCWCGHKWCVPIKLKISLELATEE